MSLSLLAGLAMLGAAGIMEINDREKHRQAYDDFLRREEERKKNLPDVSNWCLADTVCSKTSRNKSYAGFDIDKMKAAIEEDFPEEKWNVICDICEFAIMKYVVKMYGYDISIDSIVNNNMGYSRRSKTLTYCTDLNKYTSPKFYDNEKRDKYLTTSDDGTKIIPIPEEEMIEKGYGTYRSRLPEQLFGKELVLESDAKDTVEIFGLVHSWYKRGIIEKREVNNE